MTRPRVLMVTGAYYPELSGGSLQCRELIRALGDRARCHVLTTSTDRSLPAVDDVEGIPVHRVWVDVARRRSRVSALGRLLAAFLRLRHRVDIVHLHGFSRKSLVMAVLAILFRKRLVVKMSSVGHDDPVSIRRTGRAAAWCYARANLFIGVSPRLQALYESSGLPPERFVLIPNGVDVRRFRPADHAERTGLRRALGLEDDLVLILFVGFFSREKHPDVLFDAWARTVDGAPSRSGLVFVGATSSRYYEIVPDLARRIQEEARRIGVDKQLVFVEATREIEAYYRAVDIFVLPSSREGLPNALLEAMASGLPCIASRLDGVTDALIDDGRNGLLVAPGNVAALAAALRSLLADPGRAQAMGRRARATVEGQYSIVATATRYLAAYERLTTGRHGSSNPSCVG